MLPLSYFETNQNIRIDCTQFVLANTHQDRCKNAINLFTSKLADSKQYMDIQSIDMTFNKSPLGGGVQDISFIITLKLYYVTL